MKRTPEFFDCIEPRFYWSNLNLLQFNFTIFAAKEMYT